MPRSGFLRYTLGLVMALVLNGTSAAETGVTTHEILVGQSLGLTGPLAELGVDIASGVRAYFDAVNGEGGIKRVSVVYRANSFGRDGLAGAEAAMAKRPMKPHSVASIETSGADTDKAVNALHDSRPEAIILITADKPTFEFIKGYNKVGRGMQFYTRSVMGAQANINALCSNGVAVVVTSVVPFPWSQAHPLVKEYQAAMQQISVREYSFVSFESYINAKVPGEAIKRGGKDLTRAKLVDAAEGMKLVSLGGFDINFGKESRQGSRFVDVTIIGPNGRFAK